MTQLLETWALRPVLSFRSNERDFKVRKEVQSVRNFGPQFLPQWWSLVPCSKTTFYYFLLVGPRTTCPDLSVWTGQG